MQTQQQKRVVVTIHIDVSVVIHVIADIVGAFFSLFEGLGHLLLSFLGVEKRVEKKHVSERVGQLYGKNYTHISDRGAVLGEETAEESEPAMVGHESDSVWEEKDRFAWDFKTQNIRNVSGSELQDVGNCRTCGTPMFHRRKGATFCSEKCRSDHHNAKKKRM